jgi:spermidine synthase
MAPSPAERISESSMTDLWNVWFSELHRRRAGLTIKIKQLLYSGKSPYQRIDVLDSYEFGRILVLYGSIMVTEKDEFVYHEMLSHVPLFAHPNPKRVLIIGGGDGGTLREVMRHKGV